MKTPATTTVKPAATAPVKQTTTTTVKPTALPATKPAYTPTPQIVKRDSIVDKTIKGQYLQLLSKVYHYQAPLIVDFYKIYTDTLSTERRKLKLANDKLVVQSKAIDSLENNKTQALQDSESKLNTMGFLGMTLSKTAYSVLMWALVIILALALFAVVYLSSSSRHEASYRTKLYDELSTEFQAYKIKANEREKKLARELQTERNKWDDLKGGK